MQTRIEGIENPRNVMMRLIYRMSKRKFGKVITPLKVIFSRLPTAFSWWVNRIHPLERKLDISEELALLVRIYVSQLNTCQFCMDIGKAMSIGKFKNEAKFFQLADYRQSDIYTVAEKAALDFAHALTVHKKISDEVFGRARQHFSESQLIAIAWVVSTEHLYNLMNVAFDIESDGLCQIPARQPVLTEA